MYDSQQIATYLNMTLEDYTFLMALNGSLVGFIFLYFAIQIAVSIGGKK